MEKFDLKSPEAATMLAGRFVMALFATEAERLVDLGAEDAAKKAQAEAVAQALNISLEDALPKIGKERLPDGIPPFMALKKKFVPQGFMAEENADGLKIQAAIRIIETIKGNLKPEAKFDPKMFPDTPNDLREIQNHFKSVLSRLLPDEVNAALIDTNDAVAFNAATVMINTLKTKYALREGRERAAASLNDYAESLNNMQGMSNGLNTLSITSDIAKAWDTSKAADGVAKKTDGVLTLRGMPSGPRI